MTGTYPGNFLSKAMSVRHLKFSSHIELVYLQCKLSDAKARDVIKGFAKHHTPEDLFWCGLFHMSNM